MSMPAKPCSPAGCPCQTSGGNPPSHGQLYMWFAAPHMRGKVVACAEKLQWTADTSSDDVDIVLTIAEEHGHPGTYQIFFDAFTSNERDDSRVLIVSDHRVPTLADAKSIESLDKFLARQQGHWLTKVIDDGQLKTQFQPIVAAHDPRHVVAHECLLRGIDEDGAMINPGRMFDAARAAGLLFVLDAAARITAVETANQMGVTSSIFINFTPTSIYDPTNCLKTTINAIDKTDLEREQFVFEVVESDRIDDMDHLANVLREYRNNGFRVALDDVGAGYSSLNLLPVLKPDFVKIDMGLIQGVHLDAVKAAVVERLIELAHDIGASVIAEGIETQEELYWLTAKGVDLMQGFLLARPADAPVLSLDRRADK